MADVKVHVSVVIDSIDPPKFHFKTTDLPMESPNILYFRNCRMGDNFLIDYELVGAPNYRFPPNETQALYARVGSKTDCPSAGTWGQFSPQAVLDSPQSGPRRVLQVRNMNNTPLEFAYTLRITDGTNWVSLDPGGVNQNGGQPLYSQAYYYVGAALVGAVATYFGLMAAGLIQG